MSAALLAGMEMDEELDEPEASEEEPIDDEEDEDEEPKPRKAKPGRNMSKADHARRDRKDEAVVALFANGATPSHEQIARTLGLGGVGGIPQMLRRLRREGKLPKQPKKARQPHAPHGQRDEQVEALVVEYREKRGRLPTYREICGHLGLRSGGSISHVIDRLRQRGIWPVEDRRGQQPDRIQKAREAKAAALAPPPAPTPVLVAPPAPVATPAPTGWQRTAIQALETRRARLARELRRTEWAIEAIRTLGAP